MPSSRQLIGGVLGSLAGGLLFGIVMQATGGMPLVASLIGGNSVLWGWMVHGVVSVVAGIIFPFFFRSVVTSVRFCVLSGFVYGLLWWVLGPLAVMPLLLGTELQFTAAFSEPMLTSLLGHAIFGTTLGLVYRAYTKAPVPMVIA